MSYDKTSILVMHDNGKVRQLRASSKSIRNLVIFTVFLSCLFIFSNISFFSLLMDTLEMKEMNKQMVHEISLVKRKIKKVKSALRETQSMLALAQAVSEEHQQTDSNDKTSTENSRQNGAKFGIKNLTLTPSDDPSKLRVQLTVVNQDLYRRAGNGRIIMVAAKEKLEPYFYASYPQVPLLLGEPTNFKKGHPFVIKNFKQIDGHFKRPSSNVCFDQIGIYLYSDEGTLLLREKFRINEILCDKNRTSLSRY